jgi:putative heme iron utilization protein
VTDAPTDPFAPAIAAAVVAHMNGDHAADNLLIVRSLGGVADATAATMTGIGPDGAHFSATSPVGEQAVTIPWAVPITDRSTIRVEVVRMYHDACAALGVEPRAEGEH